MPTVLNAKKLVLLSAMCAALLAANGCDPRGDHVLDTWEAQNGAMKIRIRTFDEKPTFFLPKQYFVFEAAAGSDQWREIMTWEADQGFPIRPDWVQM